jgi:hypothetical protein
MTRACRRTPDTDRRALTMVYLSDTNLRAVLTVLLVRLGGEINISNEELYDAMMPEHGLAERFVIEETASGIRVSVQDRYGQDRR